VELVEEPTASNGVVVEGPDDFGEVFITEKPKSITINVSIIQSTIFYIGYLLTTVYFLLISKVHFA